MSGQKVFISYSHEDRDWVHDLASALKEQDILVWFDEWNVRAGESIQQAMEQGLRDSDAIVAVLTPATAQRPNVAFELGVALGLGKRLIPILLGDVKPGQIPSDLRTRRFLRQESPDKTARAVAEALGAKS